MRWYDVVITGSFKTKKRDVRATVRARDEETAVRKALGVEFGVPCYDIVWCVEVNRGRVNLVFTLVDDGDRYVIFRADQAALEEVVCEVTDPVRLARLDGAPELPLGPTQGETAAPTAR